MSDTTETVRRRLRDDSPAIDAVFRRLERELEGDERALAVDFAEIFLSRAPQEVLRQNEDILTGITRGAFRFLLYARPWRTDVAVFNPELERDGWYLPVTVVQTNVSERPFIVDTIREFLHAEDLAIERIIYPMLDVARDAEGRVRAIGRPSDGGPKESLVHCEVGRVSDPERLRWIEAELTRRLQDVVRATDDFAPMVDAINGVVADLAEASKSLPEQREEMEEIQAFLRWLRDGGFVFLGYRAYDLVDGPGIGALTLDDADASPDGSASEDDDEGERSVIVESGSGLGILRNEADSRFASPVPLSSLEPGMRELAERGPLLVISKTNATSTVHRGARMDYIGVKKLGSGGRVVGEHRFIGLFTSKAYTEAAENIPILRRKLARILEESGTRRGSHDYKEIITIFNSMPKEELFLTSAEEIGEDIRTVLTSYNTEDVLVTVRSDPLKRGLSVMVILPKERFSGDVRRAIESQLVTAFGGDVLNYHLTLGAGDQARLHFHMGASVERRGMVTAAQLEQLVAQLIRTWTDRLLEGLERAYSAEEARELARTYGQAFSQEYQAATEPEVAVGDVARLEAMLVDGRSIAIALANREGSLVAGVEGATELKVFLREARLILSDFMPLLENAGLRVIAVKPYEVGGNGTPQATIYVFAVQDADGEPLDVEARGELLAEAILAVRSGDAISDLLNSLVVTAGLHWRQIDVLRGYTAYAFQLGAVPSRLALPTALVRYPGIARELLDIFEIKFDPDRVLSHEERLAAVADVRSAFHGSLRGVSKLAEDRALRRLEELLVATVRTNFYRGGGVSPTARSGGVPYVSYKFACQQLELCRRSRLLYEVWVHSSRMEGVHLRGAMVARGGIRWSDRPDDFRTEVQGLVRTQVVKNAVIVPGGSKGGFITRWVPDEPGERFAEGQRQYETLIRGLLDMTDDLADGKPVAPERVVAYDPPDPYLVVAADKGTSTFSDVANRVSKEYGFWLQDAFASGGSHGYDHKAVGITARGAWESVKRHFREKGKDVQAEPFTAVGIGDMSGDVFGNGMLLSRQTRLVAAFDHRHVFIDPDPDPERSFAERGRLFRLERSSWDDYDRAVLSPGGMIVPRGAKEVDLTPEARRVLGLTPGEDEQLDGESLIRAVLRAPVELLWNGGIGTYVKASTETAADAGDPSNDAVRVDASELRCEVVGEGGNLGFTQRARIEYALLGGRINTDALDNSGGVDMSDHEVNLKILLAPAVASGRITEEGRNELLEELTEEVARLVIQDNIAQSLAVSLDELRAHEAVDDFRDLMFSLEKAGELDRTAESLPSLDVLVERRDRGQTLVRPELCVLLAYSKLSLKTGLLASGLPDDPVTESYLVGYFPPAATLAVGSADLNAHRLRREIIASQLTNDLVDVMGATFVARMMRDTGRTAEEVARAWLVAARLADHRALVARMAEERSTLEAPVAYRWILGLSRVLERTTRWVLLNVDPDVSPASIVAQNLSGLATLRDAFGEVVTGEERLLFEARVREIQAVGADEAFSKRLITLRFLDQLLEILEIARETESQVMATAQAYYRASELLDVPWLRRSAFAAAGDDQWEHRAVQVLSEDVSAAHRRIVIALMRAALEADSVIMATDALLRSRARDVERYQGVVAELKKEPDVGLAAISVAVRELSALADRVA